ncbi:MAG TPA: hypothetical protein PK022_01365 [Syntrophales bacterium]|nr:hypothetical protein [Syntrophales bacterium]
MKSRFTEKPGTWLAFFFFALISLMHILRLTFQIPVHAGNITIPAWVSGPGCLFTVALAWLIWREN